MEEKKFNLKTSFIEIEYKEQPSKIFFKEPLFGAQNNAIRKAIGVGGRPDEVLGREMIALACIEDAPFDFEKDANGNIRPNEANLNILRELPSSIGNKIIDIATSLTTFEEDLKKNLK